MSITIRKLSGPDSREDTLLDIDYENNTIVISDWEMNPTAEQCFGDSDIEWFYELSLEAIPAVVRVLAQDCAPVEPGSMTDEQMRFYDGLADIQTRELFRLLMTFMKKGNGFSLAARLEDNGIEVKKYSF